MDNHMVTVGKKISNSNIHCPDGQRLAVIISKGRSQICDGEVVVIGFTDSDDKRYQTWMSEESFSEARVAKILYAAKHSPEFRESLEMKPSAYAESERLVYILGQFDKPGFIELNGNLEQVPVHQELGTVINFPDGYPTNLEKHARRAGWLSVRKGDGENRLRVYANYGNAHTYNLRLESFLEGVLTNSLKKPAFFYLDLPTASTAVAPFGVKRPGAKVEPEAISQAVQDALNLPLFLANDALEKIKVGRDSWSSMKGPELESQIEPETLEIFQKAFKSEKTRLTAYRWHLRGLPAPYAIAKTKLEMERRQEYAMLNR